MKKKNKLVYLFAMITILFSCKQSEKSGEEEQVTNAKTPVTLCNISLESISESFELRGTSQFQKKVVVKANATGYVNNVTMNIELMRNNKYKSS